MMILLTMLLMLANVACGQDDPLIKRKAADYVASQWGLNFDPNFVANFWGQLDNSSENGLSKGCIDGLKRINASFTNDLLHFGYYFDSWGKPGPGILDGNNEYWGYYEECVDLKKTILGEMDFCKFPFVAEMHLQNYTFPFILGVCLPHACSTSEFSVLLNYTLSLVKKQVIVRAMLPQLKNLLNQVNITVDPSRSPQCPWRDEIYNGATILFLVFCGILVGLAILGSSVDGYMWYYKEWWPKQRFDGYKEISNHEESGYTSAEDSVSKIDSNSYVANYGTINDDEDDNLIPQPHVVKVSIKERYGEMVKEFLLCFSWFKNVSTIFSTSREDNDPITCISGIGVFAMLWHILSRGYILGYSFDVFENKLYIMNTLNRRFLIQPLLNAHSTIDTLFLLSGLSFTYSTLNKMRQQNGKLSLIHIYIHRFFCITPLYYFFVIFYYKIFIHVAHGTNWYFRDLHQCRDYLWTNLLYINNFYPTEIRDKCYTITWYIAIEMQLFIFTPIIVFLLYRYWQSGLAIIFSVLCVSLATIGVIAGTNDYNANQIRNEILAHSETEVSSIYNDIYYKPYCRVNAYLIGILLGFVLYRKWEIPGNLLLRLVISFCMVCVAVAIGLAVVFGLYGTWHGHTLSGFGNVIYLMLSGTAWSVAIALIIYVCHSGFGFAINTFLSWGLFVPLHRMSIGVYLIQVMVMLFFYGTLQARFIFTVNILFAIFGAVVLLTYPIAMLFATFVEYPFLNLEQLILKWGGWKEESSNKEEI